MLHLLIAGSFVMSRGWVVCTHILSRILLLHLFPETRPTPQAAQTDERGKGQKDGDGERAGGSLMTQLMTVVS